MLWEEKMHNLSKQNGWIVIGISGITNSGKTTVARKLMETFPSVAVNQDIYFRELDDPNHVWVDLKPAGRYQNWELLVCIDWKQMCEKVYEIVSQPAPNGKAFIILDGHIVFNYRPLANICVEKFFIELDKETVYSRRIHRIDQPDPPGYFDQCAWPMYLKNKKDVEEQQITYIDGLQTREEIFNIVFRTLNRLL